MSITRRASRILLGDTPTTPNTQLLLTAIEHVAHSMGLYIAETSAQDSIVLTFSDAYSNEVGEITMTCINDFCRCGKSAIAFQAPPEMAWLLWARPRH